MDRTCRCSATEQSKSPLPVGMHARRHGEAGQNHEGEQDEENNGIAQLLKNIVMSRCFAHLKAEQGMIFYVAPDMAGTDIFPPHGEVAAAMPVQKAPEQVERSEERRVGKEGVSTGSARWAPYH